MNFEQALDFRDHYERKVAEAADYIKNKLGNSKPVFGIVLGSGLGDLASSIEDAAVIAYEDIPNFPTTTIPGHEGKLLIGKIEGVPVIGLKGRKHYYEVADEPFNAGILQTVFPVHVLANLGVGNYFVTNAAGGLNMRYSVGDIMIIRSHINLLPNSLLGRHNHFDRIDDGNHAWRFQPMNGAYDQNLSKLLLQAGGKRYVGGIGRALSDFAFFMDLTKRHVHEGTYLAVTGPTYETEAECVAFRDGLRADAVGMSTTPEVIVARNRGMRVVGMSCITNVIAADGTNATNHEEVKAILDSSEVRDRLSSTVINFFRNLNKI